MSPPSYLRKKRKYFSNLICTTMLTCRGFILTTIFSYHGSQSCKTKVYWVWSIVLWVLFLFFHNPTLLRRTFGQTCWFEVTSTLHSLHYWQCENTPTCFQTLELTSLEHKDVPFHCLLLMEQKWHFTQNPLMTYIFTIQSSEDNLRSTFRNSCELVLFK